MSYEMEQLALKGRIVQKEKELRRLELSIQGYINAIRMMLAPFSPLEEIEAEQAAVQCVEMAGKHAEYIGLREEIKNMRRALS